MFSDYCQASQEVASTLFLTTKDQSDHLHFFIIAHNCALPVLQDEVNIPLIPDWEFEESLKSFLKRCFDVCGNLGKGNLSRDKPVRPQKKTMSWLKIGLWDKNELISHKFKRV